MRDWLSWIFRGYRSLGLAIEPICQRVNALEAAGKTFTAACSDLDATREHLRMAWTRIEALEKQNAKLAALMTRAPTDPNQHEQRIRIIEERTDPLQEAMEGRMKGHDVMLAGVQIQLADLRRLIIAREPEKPAPIKARNWREVQQFTRDQEESDVAR